MTFLSPEATLLLVSANNLDLWEGPTPEVCNSQTSHHSVHAQSQVWQIWLAESMKRILCACSENQIWQEVMIVGADQKECSLWGQECTKWQKGN